MDPAAASLVAVLYFRVSTEEQSRKGFSLPEQRRECLAKAQSLARERQALLQVHEFSDAASGEILERPGLEACRDFLSRVPVDLFVCLDPDRFSRSLANQLLVAGEIESRHVSLVFVQHNYEQSPEGRLFFQLRGAISEFEKAKIVERTRRGRRGKLAAGGIPNYIPVYGYTWDKRTKSLQIDPETAPWVRRIFEWVAGGWSYRAVADQLMAFGVRSARTDHWHKTSVMRLTQNSTYVGRLVLNRWDCEGNGPLRSIPREQRGRPRSNRRKPPAEWVVIPVPAIIDEDLWQRAQTALANRRRLMQRGVSLLSGLCCCGLCGGRVYYMGEPARRYFRCRNRYPHLLEPTSRPDRACEWRDLKSGPVENAIWRSVTEWLQDPDALRLEHARQASLVGIPVTTALGERMAVLERELKARLHERQRVYYLFAKGLAPAGAESDLERLGRQIQALEAEVASIRSMPQAQAPAVDVGPPSALQAELAHRLASLTLEQRQRVVRMLVNSVILWPDGRFQLKLK